jgi:hypothetical protein
MTVRNWIDAGKLPAYSIGRRVRVGREDFERFIEHGRTGRVEAPSEPEPSIWDGELPPPQVP